MASKKNPLKGLSEKEIRALLEDIDSDDSADDGEDSPFEIILRGKDASKVLENLGIIRDKAYDPDEEDEEDENDSKKEPAKLSLADRILGAK